MLSGVLLDANNTTTADPGTDSLLHLLTTLIPILLFMGVLLVVIAAVVNWSGRPRRLAALLAAAASDLDRECSKCDAMQSKLNIAEAKLERALEDSGPAFIQARELEMLKSGLRILRLRDGSERIIFTKADEEDWDELYDELEEANKVEVEADAPLFEYKEEESEEAGK